MIYRGYWKNDCFNGKGILYCLKNLSVQKFSGKF